MIDSRAAFGYANRRKADDKEGLIHMQEMLIYESQKKNGAIGAFLNWLVPGVGYFYCGSVIGGVIAIILGIALWALAFVTLGIGTPLLALFYLVVIIDGFLCAGRFNKKLALRIQQASTGQFTR